MGRTIINTVLQVLVNVIDSRMTIQEAIDEPRFHHHWIPDQLYWEEHGLNRDTREILERMGHRFRVLPGAGKFPGAIGDAQIVMIDIATGDRLSAGDPRLGGVPAGIEPDTPAAAVGDRHPLEVSRAAPGLPPLVSGLDRFTAPRLRCGV